MPLEHFIHKGGQRLRFGYTTGSCAALAAQGAAAMLLGHRLLSQATLSTPKGIEVTADLLEMSITPGTARCAVRKDAGDDVDCTDGMLVFAEVALAGDGDIVIDGGQGVGRVTRAGLDQPVGAAAINRVPRQMIRQEVEAVCERFGYTGGLRVTISVPGGEVAAAKTFNPQLGIEGGISILGTTGIVEPQSLQALIDTIEVEMKMHRANGAERLIVTPGNYGESFLKEHPAKEPLPQVKSANFIGETLDFAVEMGFSEIFLVGHAGKFAKLAAGVMNTHSRYADTRQEIFAAHAGMAGAGRDTITALMNTVTADECLEILDGAGLRKAVMASILERALHHVRRRANGVQVELLLFSNRYGPLCFTPGAAKLFGLEE